MIQAIQQSPMSDHLHADFNNILHTPLAHSHTPIAHSHTPLTDVPLHPEPVLSLPGGAFGNPVRPSHRYVEPWMYPCGDAHWRATLQWEGRGERFDTITAVDFHRTLHGTGQSFSWSAGSIMPHVTPPLVHYGWWYFGSPTEAYLLDHLQSIPFPPLSLPPFL